jgi:hypothetical protein
MKVNYHYDPDFKSIWEEQNKRIEMLVINHFLELLNLQKETETYTLRSLINNKTNS